ncbi:MAG: translocation/assembly module TamB domain-containing protein, partial [Halarsenatibacteraceae bacterium]
LKDGFLEIGPARGESSAGSFDLAGGVDLLKEELELELILDDLILEEISEMADLDQDIQGKSKIVGNIDGNFSEPIFDLELWLAEAEFFGIEVSDGHGHLNYNPTEEVLFVENLDFTSRSTEIMADGQLDFSPVLNGGGRLPLIDARLDIEELTYEYINEIFDISLPLAGDVAGYVDLNGSLNAPTVNASAKSRNTSLALGDEVFEFENSSSDFYWSEGEPFQVLDLRMEKEEAVFVIEYGKFSDIFYIDYAFNDYLLSSLDSPDFDNIRGNLSASGEAGGSYNNPWVDADLELVDLIYDGYDLGKMAGRLELEEGDLIADGIDWKPGSGDFIISGKIDNILDEAELNLQVDFDEVALPYYVDSFELDVPALEYNFSGGFEVTGVIDDWLVAVDVDADSDVSDLGRLNLRGWIGEDYDLSLVGIDLGFDWLCDYLGPDVNIDGNLELIGTVYGPLDGPEVNLETTIRDFQINQYRLSQISGRVSGDVQESLEVEQELVAERGEDIRLNGEVNIPNPEASNFQLRAREFPLNLITGFFPGVNLVDGRLDGQVDFAGSIEAPDLEGQLQLSLDELNFGQPEDLSLEGDLDFSGDQVEINNFIGDYNGGGFELSGVINLIEQDNFWDLELTGDSVPLEYTGSSAEIDGTLSLSGPLYEPLITGDLNLNNLNAVVPEDFAPEGDSEEAYDPFAERRFQPEVELQVNIGNNNYFNHENAEILIQRGDLRLLYQDELQIDGQLSSNQGTIFFYNNRFSLDTARLNFRRRRGIIPDVTVRASTRTDNTDIFVRLDGLATDLNLSFVSDPEMEEEEIISLLAGRGGIGGALAGEDLNIFQIAQQEFFRFLSDTFQIEIVGNIQSEIRNAFELDRFEISTHELGWDQEVSLYIGKNLTDRLYIEGTSRIRADEQETDLSFKYDITDNTVLDGTYYGSGEFSLSIETTIEF